MKRSTRVVIAALMVFFVLAGTSCKPKDNAIVSDGDKTYWVSETPVELTIHHHVTGEKPLNPSAEVLVKLQEITNVRLTSTVPQSNSDPVLAYNLMITSRELADIILSTPDNINKYVSEGVYVPLDDLIAQHAPHLKAYLDAHPEYKKQCVAADGKMYYIPEILEGEYAGVVFIRTDWLKKLNLEVPKTIDEYYQVLKAFKERDPNGNGKADEVPFFSKFKGGAYYMYQFFGASRTWYAEDGKIKLGFYEPEFKVAVSNIAKWYKEGLIDSEIFTRGSQSREVLLGNNTGGSTHDWIASTSSFNDALGEKIPGFEFKAIAPPADINGEVKESTGRQTMTNNAWAISSKNQHQIETIKFFDFMFTEAGNRLYNFGIEGVHYTMVGGKPTYIQSLLTENKTNILLALQAKGLRFRAGVVGDWNAEEQWLNESGKEAVKLYGENKYIRPQLPRLVFTADEQKIITEKWGAIDTYMKESEQKWVLGTEKVEETFDKYLQTLKGMGIEDVIAAYNSSYQRFLNQ